MLITHTNPLVTVLQRSEHDGIGLEDTHTLQTELETLLSSVAKRMRLLEAEIQALNNTGEKNGKTEPDRPVTPSKGTKKGGKVVRLNVKFRTFER